MNGIFVQNLAYLVSYAATSLKQKQSPKNYYFEDFKKKTFPNVNNVDYTNKTTYAILYVCVIGKQTEHKMKYK